MRWQMMTTATAAVIALSGAAVADDFRQTRLIEMPGYAWIDGGFSYCPGPTPPNNEVCLAYLQSWTNDIKETSVAFWYRIDDSTGLMRTNLKILNNQLVDGDTVCFATVFSDEGWNPVYAYSHRWGVNAKGGFLNIFGPSAREGGRIQASPSLWAGVRHVSFGKRECDKYSDRGFWSKVIDAVQIGCTVLAGGVDECRKEADRLRAINDGEVSEFGKDSN